MYIAFLRPTLEYFSIVWDSCFARDIQKDWKSTGRIVTGLPPIFTSRESLYLGWQTLQNRRYAAEMVTMFKIHDGSAPT